MDRTIVAGALFAVAGLVCWPGSAARACSVCLAGDPIFDAQGASAQQQGDFSAYVELRTFEKKSGALPHEEGGGQEQHAAVEENESLRLRLLLAWTPLDRLTLSASVPFVYTRIVEREDHGETRISTSGVGDVAVNAAVVLWRNREVLPSTSFEARVFLKTPTGESRERTQGFVDKHVQPGTGSWDFGGGLAATQRLRWGTLYASALYRENTEGSLDYEYGDAVLANFAALAPLGHATGIADLDRITPGLELNFRWAEKDRFGGRTFEDSGGSILYLTPSVRFHLPWREGRRPPSLRAGVQIPLTDAWLNGFQEEGEVWTAGLLVPF